MDYRQNRMLAKEVMEREYIRNIYNQKMERIIRDRYNPTYDPNTQMHNHSFVRPTNDTLEQEVQQFNTSKLMSSSFLKNNPESIHKGTTEPYSKNIEN